MRPDEQLALRFVCTKCKSSGGQVRRIAVTGTGLSRFLDIQHNRFAAVTCQHCGFTEVYDLRVLAGKDNLGTVLDVLFSH